VAVVAVAELAVDVYRRLVVAAAVVVVLVVAVVAVEAVTYVYGVALIVEVLV